MEEDIAKLQVLPEVQDKARLVMEAGLKLSRQAQARATEQLRTRTEEDKAVSRAHDELNTRVYGLRSEHERLKADVARLRAESAAQDEKLSTLSTIFEQMQEDKQLWAAERELFAEEAAEAIEMVMLKADGGQIKLQELWRRQDEQFAVLKKEAKELRDEETENKIVALWDAQITRPVGEVENAASITTWTEMRTVVAHDFHIEAGIAFGNLRTFAPQHLRVRRQLRPEFSQMKVSDVPFAKGLYRSAWYCTSDSNTVCVAKKFHLEITFEKDNECALKVIYTTILAEMFARAFTAALRSAMDAAGADSEGDEDWTPWRVSYLIPSLVKDGNRVWLVEEMLPEFHRWSDNATRFVLNEEEGRVLAAFTHWSYHHSGQRLIVTDHQGFSSGTRQLRMTDPSVHLLHADFQSLVHYNDGNNEEQGRHDFEDGHTCTPWCQLLGLEHMEAPPAQDTDADNDEE
ncbi:kinase-like protein [Gonapodya prolifera JEL478]|uniref:Kinase-like protein n=1 Tax=Gonapodya prolifera (strain JEL478) TaxID=1344416 RepID=A0A139A023_GONPJ|nr:kinase-like protein [Gonapodya prolifera JEL478]|eukprot:KXS10126.1 kinase-like protein [Gonapodya prolifera JEL478]